VGYLRRRWDAVEEAHRMNSCCFPEDANRATWHPVCEVPGMSNCREHCAKWRPLRWQNTWQRALQAQSISIDDIALQERLIPHRTKEAASGVRRKKQVARFACLRLPAVERAGRLEITVFCIAT